MFEKYLSKYCVFPVSTTQNNSVENKQTNCCFKNIKALIPEE